MNYGELKQNIRDLAFEEDEQMEEYETIVVNAINRSLSTIEQEVAPIKNKTGVDSVESARALLQGNGVIL